VVINESRLSKALTYLAEHDEPCAHLHAAMERAEFKAKAVRDAVFMRLEGTVAERTAQAGASEEYEKAMELYFQFLGTYEAMKNKRATEGVVVDVWRSLNSSRNKGNL
jgi:hypothetical protein